MKTIKLVIIVILCLGVGFPASAQDASKSTKKKKTEEVIFKVGMHCRNCQAKIEKNIPWEKGVKDLRVDLENQKVTVSYDPKKTTEAQLQKAIEKLDFSCEKSEDKK
ncbi:MAG: heavy-metal-associated domain-containing protein [Bacteroidales bacterium]|jgi:copper chaperone CopZ|nr:heavy-metal-associated domain-containing protein [Bacteroidales bacterium]